MSSDYPSAPALYAEKYRSRSYRSILFPILLESAVHTKAEPNLNKNVFGFGMTFAQFN